MPASDQNEPDYCAATGTLSIIITCFIQNDFIGFDEEIREDLSSLLYIGKNESQRLLGTDPNSGPLMQFMKWARSQPDQDLLILHIRGWNDINDDIVKRLGSFTLKNTEGAKLVANLDDDIPNRHNEQYINASSLNAFINTNLEQILKDCVLKHKDLRIGVVGLWTDTSIHYLLYELFTRYSGYLCGGTKNLHLATCSSLTASSSRIQHFNALQQIQKVLSVNVFDSTSDLQEFLLPRWWKKHNQETDQLSVSVPFSKLPHCEKFFESLSDEDRNTISAVDKHIISYLYRDSSRVEFKRLSGGFSGSWVFRVASWDLMNQEQSPSILKVGSRSSITHERTNFERVEDVLGLNAPNIRAWCECKDRSGIKFAYASMALVDDDGTYETPSFKSLYVDSLQDHRVTIDHICQVLNKTFRLVLGKFYKAAAIEHINLFTAYDFNGKGWALRTGGSDNPDAVMKRAKKLLPNNKDSTYDQLTFGADFTITNVSTFLRDVLPKVKVSYLAKLHSLVSFQHGDLNGRNVSLHFKFSLHFTDSCRFKYECMVN
jgi:hypothetical protein